MFRPRVIPCLLLKGKGLVKTVKFKDPRYIGDPINAVRIFNEKQADELIFLDITASIEERCVSVTLMKQIANEAYMPFAVGGGITAIKQIRAALAAGAEKVVINTSSVVNPSLIKKSANMFGSQSIVISIDVAKNFWGKYEVFILSGTKGTKLDPVEHAKHMQELGAGEIFLNSMEKDGTMEGYDIEIIKKISDSVNIPVVASGGAGKLEDFKDAIYNGHASATAAGSFFVFHGNRRAVLINYPEKRELTVLFKGIYDK